ncbi:hypothetical protein [Algimonas ampicilliniresistens]|nr:hypothetical protein [Algimonas ampicilliniresistens]
MNNTTPSPASNSEVVSRYGRRAIMWRAHGFMKRPLRGIVTFADALRAAWASFRSQIDRERQAQVRRARQRAMMAKYRQPRTASLLDRNPRPAHLAWGKGSERYLHTQMGA